TAAAGRSKKSYELMHQTFDSLGISYDLFETGHFGHAIELAEQCAKDGYRIIAAGGDGTCNEILNGVIKSKTKALLGFIPIGTGNDIPGVVGYRPKAAKRACEVIAEGFTAKSDVGKAINGSENNERYFLGIGSQGFDALVTKRTNEGPKRLPGTWNYIASVVRTVFSFKRREIKLTLDDDTWTGRANLVAVGNGPTYGGFMYMCPRATPDDELFHISVVDMNSIELLYKFNLMYNRTLHPDIHVREFVSKNVKIEMVNPADDPYIAQVDGEILGEIPIQYESKPDFYEFICPQENEAEQWFQERFGKKFTKHYQKLEAQGNDYWKGIFY
ncbi:MAG: diacylglycerol/lipid kinase family protein, partial [Promethearchaeota archaeon]